MLRKHDPFGVAAKIKSGIENLQKQPKDGNSLTRTGLSLQVFYSRDFLGGYRLIVDIAGKIPLRSTFSLFWFSLACVSTRLCLVISYIYTKINVNWTVSIKMKSDIVHLG